MEPNPILENLLRFLAQLDPTDLEKTAVLGLLEELLSSLDGDDLFALNEPRFLQEKSAWSADSATEEERLNALRERDWQFDPGREPRFRLLRREVPLARAIIGGSQPQWAVGAAPERSIGPLTGRDGRRFWLDLYPIVRPVPLYRAAEQDPALLFFVSDFPQPHLVPDLGGRLLHRFQGMTLELEAGSFWVRADLLGLHAPAQAYIGLKIDSGRIALSKEAHNIFGKLTLGADTTCSVSLRLAEIDQGDQPPGGGKMRTPDHLEFHFSQNERGLDSAGDADWHLFGRPLTFDWNGQGRPIYDDDLRGVLIPLTADADTISVADADFGFARVQGGAAIRRSAWLLPAAEIDVMQPAAPGNNGAMAVQGNSDLSLTWAGLRDGPIFLPQPWIVQFPGLLLIIDQQAGNLLARQRFLLWQDAGAPYRSSVEVRYTASFPLLYAANDQGAELVMAQVDAEAKLDRPVDTAGSALQVRSRASALILGNTPELRLVYLFDENMISDNLPQATTTSQQLPEPISIALRNALFTITPVNSFFLFADLLDDEMVGEGNVLLLFGLYGMLPTLPDPYAANAGVFRELAEASRERRVVWLLLLNHIAWLKAAGSDPDLVQTNFHLLPLPQIRSALLSNAINLSMLFEPREPDPEDSSIAAAGARYQSELDQLWHFHFGRFYDQQFALLDVSTNADWMGVSLGWFSPESVRDVDNREKDRIFYEIYGVQQTGEQSQQLFPLQVRGLDLTAEGRFVRAFALPQNSWEPLINMTPPDISSDPPQGLNIYPNDGGPTLLFNTNRELVPIAPLPKVEELIAYFKSPAQGRTGALFTLPFGLRAFAEINKNRPQIADAGLRLNQEQFREGKLTGALQIQVNAPKRPDRSPTFIGSTLQLDNILGTNTGTLGGSVATIFNKEFFTDIGGYGSFGVPLTRIDFAGYGSSTFSRWENPNAVIAATSQTRFDIAIGRTAHEVVQVKSIIYPWAIHVVRTIIIFRAANGFVFRYDTGWQAESDGVYDFSYRVNVQGQVNPQPRPNPYEIHPGVVRGVFSVRNIKETKEIPPFKTTWQKNNGEKYINGDGIEQIVDGTTDAKFKNAQVILQPVYFDADVEIDYLKGGSAGGRTPARKMLGYVQLAPRGEPLSPELFRDLLREQRGSLGGPVDCLIDIGNSNQQMRVTRVEVSESVDSGGKPVFSGTSRGSVVLPKDGSWSVVQYVHGSGDVSPMADATAVPLIRQGKLGAAGGDLRLDSPLELLRPPQTDSVFFGLLQSTGTQKALFRQPRFQDNVKELLSEKPDFADAYRMLDSVGIFPNLKDTYPLDLGAYKTKIIEEGYRLLDELNPDAVLESALPDDPFYLINEGFLKLYIEYDKRDKKGNKQQDGKINFGFDAIAQDVGKRWLSKLNDIAMIVDLGPLTRLMMIKGKFDAEKGAAPTFKQPELEFSDELQPVIDLLEILAELQGGNYGAALEKGLEIAMSNSADSWAYAFHARKEIPLIRFPSPDPGPTTPLRLEASLSVGVYFNEVMALPASADQLIPSAGAFLAFYGRLSVMCISLAAATIYATGSVDLRLAADIKTGPSLFMKFGFGAEIVVGLPVIGNVSILYMVGVEISLDSSKIAVGAFLLYRGRAEILGGIVTVTISIEAKGTYTRIQNPQPMTNMTAQVTFGLDISIFLVINISFSESWQETRQIA
ncbi:MAG: hypothetical protein ACK2UR_16515 [Candidatus Promineifilaceae bacterium]